MSKMNPISNYTAVLLRAHATLAAAATSNSTSVDLATGGGVAFFVNMSSIGTGGSITYTVQHSEDNSTFTAETADAGNNTTASVAATGLAQISVPNPRAGKRYYRLSALGVTDTTTFSVIAIKGPNRTVSAG